jgi:hypothetical protein
MMGTVLLAALAVTSAHVLSIHHHLSQLWRYFIQHAARVVIHSFLAAKKCAHLACIEFKSQHALQGWMLACCMTLHTLA